MGVLLLWELYLTKKHKIFRLVQGPIVVVAVGIICQVITKSFFPQYHLGQEYLVSVPVASGISSFFGQFTFPDFSQIGNKDVYFLALTIALVASLETLLCVEATDKLDPHKRVTPTNRELFAQGSRKHSIRDDWWVSDYSSNRSEFSKCSGWCIIKNVCYSSWGFSVDYALPLFQVFLTLVPLPALACILLMVGYKLAKPVLICKTIQTWLGAICAVYCYYSWNCL